MKKLIFAVCAFALTLPQVQAQNQQVRVEIENLAPAGGVALTPLWVGFHDGSFDTYNGGLSSQPGLERIAEDGNTGQISTDFLAGRTYIDTSSGSAVSATVASSQLGSARVDGTIAAPGGAAPVIEAGETASAIFNLDPTENEYFSYASMILPSNDYYVANGSPFAHGLGSLFGNNGASTSFFIGTPNGGINDAGTEINDFDTSAGNGLFGITDGQSGPDQGADEGGVNANVVGDPFAGFANLSNADGIDLAALNFNNYTDGIARITITAIPEPTSLGLVALGLGGMFLRRRRS